MKTKTGPESNLGCQWILAVLVGIFGVIFLIWLINRNPEKDEADRKEREAFVNAKQAEWDSLHPKIDIYPDLKNNIIAELKAAEIPCFGVKVTESGCVWVYTTDTGKNRDGLASTLCSTVKKYHRSCITIVDRNQNSLGRSNCN